MLQSAGDVTRRVQALLDNPSGSRFSSPYILAFIDLEYDEMDVDLERLGMQYIEQKAIFDVAAKVTDLTYALAAGLPLQYMKRPKRIDWKLVGQQDVQYSRSEFVDELVDVSSSSYGVSQWRFADGAIEITSSAQPCTIRVYYDAVSTDIYDAAQNVIRGTAHILALRTAATIAAINNGMGTVQKKLDTKAASAWTSFCRLSVMNNQGKRIVPRPMHPRNNQRGSPTILAPTP